MTGVENEADMEVPQSEWVTKSEKQAGRTRVLLPKNTITLFAYVSPNFPLLSRLFYVGFLSPATRVVLENKDHSFFSECEP